MIWLPVLCFLLGAGAVLVSDERDGLGALLELRGQVRAAQVRSAQLESDEQDLARQIRELREDEFAIEAAARSELGMVRPGEIVVRFQSPGDGG